MVTATNRPLPQSKIIAAKVTNINSRRKAGAPIEKQVVDDERNDEDVKAQINKPPVRHLNRDDQAVMDSLLDEVKNKQEHIISKLDIVVLGSQNLVRQVTNYRDADADERYMIKENGLAAGVQALEALEIMEARIKGLRKDAMHRLTKVLGYEASYLKEAIKERKKPKQMVLDFYNVMRTEVDKIHTSLEAKGVERKGDDYEPNKVPKPRKGGRGKGKK